MKRLHFVIILQTCYIYIVADQVRGKCHGAGDVLNWCTLQAWRLGVGFLIQSPLFQSGFVNIQRRKVGELTDGKHEAYRRLSTTE